jgi:hypothetical protein
VGLWYSVKATCRFQVENQCFNTSLQDWKTYSFIFLSSIRRMTGRWRLLVTNVVQYTTRYWYTILCVNHTPYITPLPLYYCPKHSNVWMKRKCVTPWFNKERKHILWLHRLLCSKKHWINYANINQYWQATCIYAIYWLWQSLFSFTVHAWSQKH